jgi:hypothetical protein
MTRAHHVRKRNTKHGQLEVDRMVDVPLREISGICVRRSRNRQVSLVAVGDHAAHLAWAPLSGWMNGKLDWHVVDITKLAKSELPKRDPQIEAVCADGAGRVLLLQESPPRAELVDLGASKVIASISLEFEGRSELARSWASLHGSRGEGVVLLPGGHLLIAKEKDPAALIEFGPRGSPSKGLTQGRGLKTSARWSVSAGQQTLVACAVWTPDEKLTEICADFSDLAIGPDDRLYLLSDKSEAIARIDNLKPEGGTASLTAAWRLSDLGGKPEGLAFTADGSAIVALDRRKSRRNLVLLKPAIAKPNRTLQGQTAKPISERVAKQAVPPPRSARRRQQVHEAVDRCRDHACRATCRLMGFRSCGCIPPGYVVFRE